MANYHVWHHPTLDGQPAFATTDLTVPSIDPVSGLSSSTSEIKTFQSLRNDMAQLRADGVAKGIVDGSLVDIGTSTEGRELWALKIGTGTDHKVLFTGCHHAREWVSVEVPFLVAKFLIDTFTKTPTNEKEKRVKHLLENRQIWFVPMVNPDGHDHAVKQDRMWRPNRRTFVVPTDTVIVAPQLNRSPARRIRVKAASYRGVDLNRNYPTTTWGKETVATSRDPADSRFGVWTGPSPGSEVETQLIVNLNLTDAQMNHQLSQRFAGITRQERLDFAAARAFDHAIDLRSLGYPIRKAQVAWPSRWSAAVALDRDSLGRVLAVAQPAAAQQKPVRLARLRADLSLAAASLRSAPRAERNLAKWQRIQALIAPLLGSD